MKISAWKNKAESESKILTFRLDFIKVEMDSNGVNPHQTAKMLINSTGMGLIRIKTTAESAACHFFIPRDGFQICVGKKSTM